MKTEFDFMKAQVRSYYERFNKDYGNLVDLNKVDEALNNIVVAKDDYSNISTNAKRYLASGSKGLFDGGKI